MNKNKMGRNLSVFCLAAALTVMPNSVFLSETVFAEDTEVSESAEGQVSENMTEEPVGETEAAPEEYAEDLGEQAEGSSEILPEPDGGADADKNADGDEEGDAVYPVLIPLDSSYPQYEQLSAFLALSADKFQVYMVTFADEAGTPVQPDGAVQVAADIPADYDMTRTVISEVSMNGDTPQRTELSYTAIDGKAVFQTDHAGLFVVMVKKDQPQLPPSLEMTDKVEHLELNKGSGASANMTGNSSVSSVPKTGDQAAPFLWLGASAAVSAGLILTVIANSTKKSKKS